MKTAVASFIIAALNFLEEKKFAFKGTLSFILTADEEGEAEFGTKSVIKWLKKKKKKIDTNKELKNQKLIFLKYIFTLLFK